MNHNNQNRRTLNKNAQKNKQYDSSVGKGAPHPMFKSVSRMYPCYLNRADLTMNCESVSQLLTDLKLEHFKIQEEKIKSKNHKAFTFLINRIDSHVVGDSNFWPRNVYVTRYCPPKQKQITINQNTNTNTINEKTNTQTINDNAMDQTPAQPVSIPTQPLSTQASAIPITTTNSTTNNQ